MSPLTRDRPLEVGGAGEDFRLPPCEEGREVVSVGREVSRVVHLRPATGPRRAFSARTAITEILRYVGVRTVDFVVDSGPQRRD